MMSTGDNSRAEAPFGYTFDFPHSSNPSASYPAPGPPLLDNNESGILETFWENPNNVDPTFLSVPTNYHGDHSSLFSSTNPLDWMSAHALNLSHPSESPTGRSISQPNLSRPDHGGFNPRGEQQAHSVPASEDVVYAATRLLHNNQAGRFSNMSGQYNGYPNMSSAGHDMSPSNGFGYPPIPSPHSTPYNFNSAPAGSNMYNMNSFGAQYNNSEQSAGRPVDGRGPAIRFGSDNNFRNSYSGPSQDPHEKEVVDGFAQLYQVAHQAEMAEAAQALPEHNQRKRLRVSSEPKDAAADSEDESSEEESKSSKKRRKSKPKEDDEDDFDEGINGRRKSSSGHNKSRTQKATAASPPKKNKALPSASKAQRENLSEEQKRSNHIQSEQKRRNLIKQGFEDLNHLVPELRAGGFSKSNMLVEAAKFMKRLREENDDLRAHMRSMDNG